MVSYFGAMQTRVLLKKSKKAVRKILHKNNHPTKPLHKNTITQQLTENIKSLFYRRERAFGDNDIKYYSKRSAKEVKKSCEENTA